MKVRSVILSSILIAFGFNPLSSYGADILQKPASLKKNTINKKQEKSIKEIQWQPGIDVYNGEKIPPYFNGVSPKRIIQWIEARYFQKKSEFEKQADYDEKVSIANNEIKFGQYAFRIPTSSIGYEKYDADNEMYIPNSRASVSGDFDISLDNSDLGSYIGSNVYGKNVKISKFFNEAYGISIDKNYSFKGNLFDIQGGYLKLVEYLNVSLSAAKKIKTNDITFLIIGEIESSIISNRSSCIKPTIDSPYDGCISRKYISLKPSRIIVYVYSTGDILYDQNHNSENNIGDDFLKYPSLQYENITPEKVEFNRSQLGANLITASDKFYDLNRINDRNKYGQTPVMEAVFDKDLKAVQELVKYGADISIKDNSGVTPLEFARINKYFNIIGVLRSAKY